MNVKRRQSIINGLTGLARKVLASVPIQAAATAHSILAEYQRVNGSITYRVLEGTLHSLVESKLVRILPSNPISFIQNGVKDNVPDDEDDLDPDPETESLFDSDMQPEQERSVAQLPVNVNIPKPADPTKQMEVLAERIRTMASQLNQLASQVEEAAILYEEKISQVSADMDKLKQLQALLKSLA